MSFDFSTNNQAKIFLATKALDRLPGVARFTKPEQPEIVSIDIGEWSSKELGVPPHPEIRVYKDIARILCSASPDLRLAIASKVENTIKSSSFTCPSLLKK